MSTSNKPSVDQLQSIVKRCRKKTPPFFKKLRTVGLIAATIGATLITAPSELPEVISSIAGYITTAGAVLTAVSQTAIDDSQTENEND